MRATASKVGGEKVGKGIKAVNEVWRERGEPFQGRASKGNRKSFAENDVFRCVEGDMGDIHL